MTARLPDPRGPAPRASSEVVEFLASHTSSCPRCGLILNGCTRSECPGCGWALELAVLREREPTTQNLVRQWDYRCPGCSYNLKGSTGDVCPECACPLDPRTLIPPAEPGRRKRGQKTMAVVLGIVVSTFFVIVLLGLWNVLLPNRPPGPLIPCFYFVLVPPLASYLAWRLLQRMR